MTEKTAGKIVIGTITLAVTLMLWFLVWPGSVWGAVFKRRMIFFGDYDSVRVVYGKHYADSAIFTDTLRVTQPKDTFVTVDKSYDWTYKYVYYSGGDSIGVTEHPSKYTAGPATISSDQLQEAAHYVECTLRVWHDSGSWLTGGIGDYSNLATYYALDTSADLMILDVDVTMKSLAGEAFNVQPTKSYGALITSPSDSMVFYGFRGGYFWFADTNNVTGNFTDTLIGYAVPIDPPSDPSLCRAHGWVKLSGGATPRKIDVTLIIEGDELVFNACDSTFLINEPMTTRTDSDGYFYFDVLPSKCLLTSDGDSLQYKVEAELGTYGSKSKSFHVPDAETYKIELY